MTVENEKLTKKLEIYKNSIVNLEKYNNECLLKNNILVQSLKDCGKENEKLKKQLELMIDYMIDKIDLDGEFCGNNYYATDSLNENQSYHEDYWCDMNNCNPDDCTMKQLKKCLMNFFKEEAETRLKELEES